MTNDEIYVKRYIGINYIPNITTISVLKKTSIQIHYFNFSNKT